MNLTSNIYGVTPMKKDRHNLGSFDQDSYRFLLINEKIAKKSS